METCLGYLVAGVFTEGRCPACRHTVRDRQLAPPRDGANHTRCSDLLAVSGTAGTSAALSLQNGLAQHLIDQGIYPGSVV
jgi:hypothetical protein